MTPLPTPGSGRRIDEIRERVDAGYPSTYVVPDRLMGFWTQHVEDARFLLDENERLREAHETHVMEDGRLNYGCSICDAHSEEEQE